MRARRERTPLRRLRQAAALAWVLGLAPLGAQAAAPTARPAQPLRPTAIAQNTRPSDAAAPVVWRVPWGAAPGMLGHHSQAEGNAECPMSFAVDQKGRAWVLDQVNGRVQVFDRQGKAERSLPIPTDTFQDILVGENGQLVLVDRLVGQSLAFLDERGGIEHEVPLVGTGVTHGGGVTAAFRQADGYWVEFDHQSLVRVATADGKTDLQRPVRPGRLAADGQSAFSARLERPTHVAIFQQQLAPAARPALFARVAFRLPILALLAMEPDQKGNVLVAAHTFREGPTPALPVIEESLAIVVLDRSGREVRRAEVPLLSGPDEQLRPVRLGEDGALYQLACEPQGAVMRRFVP